MILQALTQYYQRKAEQLPPFGFEEKAIPYIIVIDEQGKFINLESNSDTDVEGKLVVRPLRVPRARGRSGAKSYETAYILWDHYGYVAQQPKVNKPGDTPNQKALDDAEKQHQSFIRQVRLIAEALPENVGVQAVKRFLASSDDLAQLKVHPHWLDCVKIKGCNLSFRLAGAAELICQSPEVIAWVKAQALPDRDIITGRCLITGENADIARLHDMISGVNQKPAPLAAINEKAYESYNKDKGFNFPSSSQAVFQYATALNHLLRKGSPNKFRILDASYVCWAEKNHALEQYTALFLSAAEDDPDGSAAAIKSLFNSMHNGAYTASDGQQRFFILGLAPNSARIVVRYWFNGTVADCAQHFVAWFKDLDIVGREHHGYPSLKKLLRATALQFKDDNVAPNLPADIVLAILSGGRLPQSLIQAVLRRIRAEKGTINYSRACLLKAYLNRSYRFSSTAKQELTVALNTKETRIGYCLGRLFAVLEKLQEDAQPGIKTTIRDRYYSSASTTPKAVFGTLMRLSNHHLKKMDNPSWRGAADKRIREVMSLVHEFPAHLNLENQGLFAVGYYHQKQAFFTKNSEQGES